MTRRSYDGDGIRVLWNSERCIHTAICLQTLPDVFDVNARPWVDVAGADADAIAAAIERCPTGALGYERTDGQHDEVPDNPTTIIPWPNGPLLVRGSVEVRDRDGKLFDAGPRATLCRCGASKNQPFCDLSHRDIGFTDNPRVVTDERSGADAPDQVKPA